MKKPKFREKYLIFSELHLKLMRMGIAPQTYPLKDSERAKEVVIRFLRDYGKLGDEDETTETAIFALSPPAAISDPVSLMERGRRIYRRLVGYR
jgi:hypothetical protein